MLPSDLEYPRVTSKQKRGSPSTARPDYTKRMALNAAKKERAARDWNMQEARKPSFKWSSFTAADWVHSARFHHRWMQRFLRDAKQFDCVHDWKPGSVCNGIENLTCRCCGFESWRGTTWRTKQTFVPPVSGREMPQVAKAAA